MKNVLITGCSTGLGFETAAHLARNGYQVIATMRNPTRSPELGELAKKEGLPVTILTMDVDQDQSVRNAFQESFDRFGHIDVLVNNAGIASNHPVEETSMEMFQQIFQTNLFGAVRCMKEVISPMRERGEGLIINVSSIAGKTQSPSMAAYAATKSARLWLFTRYKIKKGCNLELWPFLLNFISSYMTRYGISYKNPAHKKSQK
jgi:NAD(P)-dependent dehydrogenase (short-subunit alcohol dehydrogenase family)